MKWNDHDGIRRIEYTADTFGNSLTGNHFPCLGLIVFVPVFNLEQIQPFFVSDFFVTGYLHIFSLAFSIYYPGIV